MVTKISQTVITVTQSYRAQHQYQQIDEPTHRHFCRTVGARVIIFEAAVKCTKRFPNMFPSLKRTVGKQKMEMEMQSFPLHLSWHPGYRCMSDRPLWGDNATKGRQGYNLTRLTILRMGGKGHETTSTPPKSGGMYNPMYTTQNVYTI